MKRERHSGCQNSYCCNSYNNATTACRGCPTLCVGLCAHINLRMSHLPFWPSDDAGPQADVGRTRKVFGSLDVHEYVVKHPAATYFLRMEGDALVAEGVYDGDVLVIDRSRALMLHNLVVLVYLGEMFVRKIEKSGNNFVVEIDGRDHALSSGIDVWGIVCAVVRKL